ncbi:MAG TPA: SiaB family protein kinase [Bacteroidia bacterium]|nr:SiaB family protein kinase [Bacteroidia bacterium]
MLTAQDVKGLLLDPATDWFYLGEIDEDLISSFVTLIENRPDFLLLPRPSRRRLVSAVVECLQNIQNNTPVITEPKSGSVIFMQKYSLSEFGVMCGNIMNTSEVEMLKEKLDQINSADTEILREMYMKQMEISLQGGSRTNAGLGLLEIARAVNGPIRYGFIRLNDDHTFFSLELHLSLN